MEVQRTLLQDITQQMNKETIRKLEEADQRLTDQLEMERKERRYSMSSQVSGLSVGRPMSVGSGQVPLGGGRPRGLSVLSSQTNLTQGGRRARGLSVLSTLTSRTRKSSSVEVVEMPGGAVLVTVDEDDNADVMEQRRDSLAGATTVGGMTVAPNTADLDKEIKKKMSHHSPAVGEEHKKKQDESETTTETVRSQTDEEEPLLAFGATNLLQHLFLALASPAFFRIPALAYKWSTPNGSGFFTAYAVLMLVVALPLCVLEQILAQFSSLGVITIFRCLPLLTGVGVGMVAWCVVMMLYSSTVLTWAVHYTFDCLSQKVPWATCPPGHPECLSNILDPSLNSTGLYIPSDYYFLNTVVGALHTDEGRAINLQLALMQGFLWLGLLFLVSLGKAWRDGVFSKVWSLVTICGLIVLMVNGLEMDQSDLGLQFVFNWSSSDLGRPDIWLDAFGQVMWSLGPTLGLVISRASYKRFRDRIRMDAYTAVTANLLVAMVLCLAVFPYQGLLSPSTHIDKTPGYFFVISSFAVTYLKVPQLGGLVVYLGMCKALLDHTQMLVSTVAVSVSDLLPVKWRSGSRLLAWQCVLCGLGFLFSLPFVTNEGIFLVKAVDAYMPWLCGIVLGSMEVAGLVYLYGVDNICHNFQLMVRKKLVLFAYIWKFLLLPSFLAMGVWACVQGVDGPVVWENLQLSPDREDFYRQVGLGVALLPPALALLTTLVLLVLARQSLKRLLVPRDMWGPALVQHRALYTPGIIRAKTRAPYLIIQVETDGSEEANEKGWLPYGYFWIPPKAAAHYLRETLSSTDLYTRTRIAMYLKTQFGTTKDSWLIHDNDDDDLPAITLDSPVADRVRRYGVTKLVGLGQEHSRTTSTSTLSAGVLLSPSNISGTEPHTYIHHQAFTNLSYDNQAYET